jgi:hypothetical protein
VLANLKPSGKYMVADLVEIGGFPAVLKFLIHAGLINGDIPTVTGKTLKENVWGAPSLDPAQDMIRPLDDPIKESGHIRVLRGNLAPGGAVAKITGKEGRRFSGKAMVFDKEEDLISKLHKGEIDPEENTVICVRYEGPKGGPGMVSHPSSLAHSIQFVWNMLVWDFGTGSLNKLLLAISTTPSDNLCTIRLIRKKTTRHLLGGLEVFHAAILHTGLRHGRSNPGSFHYQHHGRKPSSDCGESWNYIPSVHALYPVLSISFRRRTRCRCPTLSAGSS